MIAPIRHIAGPIMAVTQTDIDNLNAAIAQGVRQATIGGQTVLYQTTESLIKARDDMQDQLNKQTPNANRRSRQMQVVYGGRGYE